MAVYDRWHKDPAEGDQPCKCRNGRGGKLYPSAAHLKGKRWQVRWDDPDSPSRRQPRRNFALRDGDDRNLHADAYDKWIQGQLVARTYSDPRAGEVRFEEYAETWRGTRAVSDERAAVIAERLQNHVYEDPDGPGGRSRRGALSIGQHTLALLAQRPTLAASWVVSLKGPMPAEATRRMVVATASAVCAAAVADNIIQRNPFDSPVVQKPRAGSKKTLPFTAAELEAIALELPERLRLVPRLGAGTGMREMELAALGVHDFQTLGKHPRVTVERQLKFIGGRHVFTPIKNRKPHTVPLAPAVAVALNEHLAEHPAAEVELPWHEPGNKEEHGKLVKVRLILLDDQGGPLTRGAMHSAWGRAVAKAAGLTSKGFVAGRNIHRLRHTYASMQLRKGVDVVRVASWLGDTVDTVVKTYAHLLPDDEGDADGRAAVDGFFAPCTPDVPSESVNGMSSQLDGLQLHSRVEWRGGCKRCRPGGRGAEKPFLACTFMRVHFFLFSLIKT